MIASLKRGDASAAAAVGRAAGVVHRDVEPAVRGDDALDEGRDLLGVAHVARLEAVRRTPPAPSRPHTTTVAPASASRSAMAAPMPLVPPVTRATCPLRSTTMAIGAKVYQTGGSQLGS